MRKRYNSIDVFEPRIVSFAQTETILLCYRIVCTIRACRFTINAAELFCWSECSNGDERKKKETQQVRSSPVAWTDALNHKDAACAAPLVDLLPIFVCSAIPKTTIDFLELRSLRLHHSHYYYCYYLNRKSCVCRETNTHLVYVQVDPATRDSIPLLPRTLVCGPSSTTRVHFDTTTTKTSRTKTVHSQRVSHTLRPPLMVFSLSLSLHWKMSSNERDTHVPCIRRKFWMLEEFILELMENNIISYLAVSSFPLHRCRCHSLLRNFLINIICLQQIWTTLNLIQLVHSVWRSTLP